jgi:hypothetical protein
MGCRSANWRGGGGGSDMEEDDEEEDEEEDAVNSNNSKSFATVLSTSWRWDFSKYSMGNKNPVYSLSNIAGEGIG